MVVSTDEIDTYSNEPCTALKSRFRAGDAVYFNGGLCELLATVNTQVRARVYLKSDSTLKATPFTKTYNFVANTLADIRTDICGADGSYMIDTTGYADGMYTIKVDLSGTGAYSQTFTGTFEVYTPPSVVFTGQIRMDVSYIESGNHIHIDGVLSKFKTDVAVTGASALLRVKKVSDGSVIATLASKTGIDFEADTYKTLTVMGFSSGELQYTPNVMADIEYFFEVFFSGGSPAIHNESYYSDQFTALAPIFATANVTINAYAGNSSTDLRGRFIAGDTIHLNGTGVSLDVSKTDVNVLVELIDVETGNTVATMLDATTDFTASVAQDWADLNGGTEPTYAVTASMQGKDFYIKVTVSGTNVTEGQERCYFDIQPTQAVADHYDWISTVMDYIIQQMEANGTLDDYTIKKILGGHYELKNILPLIDKNDMLIVVSDEDHTEKPYDTQSVEWGAVIKIALYTRRGKILKTLTDAEVISGFMPYFSAAIDLVESIRKAGNQLGYWEDIIPAAGKPTITKLKNNVIVSGSVECRVRYISTTQGGAGD